MTTTSFAVQLKDFADKTNRKFDDVVRNVTVSIVRKLDERSPVGDPTLWKHPAPKDYKPGRFRGNWQLGVNFAPAGETGRLDPSGAETVEINIGAIGDHPAGTIIWIVNNVPYGRPIEDGHSTQAPQGLVALTAIEFQQMVNASALMVAA